MDHWFRMLDLEQSVHFTDGEIRSLRIPKVGLLAQGPLISWRARNQFSSLLNLRHFCHTISSYKK